MLEAFIGSIVLFAGNFAPRGWALCEGQILPIAQNTALFSILGTTYGGNGQTTFALPDLRGRVPLSQGQGPGLPNIQLGEMGGQATVTLITPQIPAHTHTLQAANGAATTSTPQNGLLATWNGTEDSEGTNVTGHSFVTGATPTTTLAPTSIGSAGGSQPHNNMQPYLGLNYIICLEGIYPSRG
ncbi:phage tail protein [Hugenholtzia roseola]|uniref:phage tail protein n=1 Tax=Hugenholtzia roseola TaxID=1002 RepID=UPI00047B2DE8|nr:tail fiber protein [Hugenholtzia roseola]